MMVVTVAMMTMVVMSMIVAGMIMIAVGVIMAVMIMRRMIMFVRGTGHCQCIPPARPGVKRLRLRSQFSRSIAPYAQPR